MKIFFSQSIPTILVEGEWVDGISSTVSTMEVPNSSFDEQQEPQSLLRSHLEWSDRQRRILTADGRATEMYCASRGFAFAASELPHHHLARNKTREVFDAWRKKQGMSDSESDTMVVGAWFRTLFMGESDFTSRHDEEAYNVQTQTLFVDLRIPRSRRHVFGRRDRQVSSLDDVQDGDELRWQARQHVFAGYTEHTSDKRPGMAGCCVRHHCLDWNYVGAQRPVPNKWWVERNAQRYPNQWKEWAYATNDVGHPYYGEVWERLSSNTPSSNSVEDPSTQQAVIALRKRALSDRRGPTGQGADSKCEDDGVLVIVGDHFSYCVGRPLDDPVPGNENYADCTSLVDLVDRAVDRGDFGTARAWLARIGGGHGRISSGWIVDLATEFWKEGTPFWAPDQIVVAGVSLDSCTVRHGPDEWDVFECNLSSATELKSFFIAASSNAEASAGGISESNQLR
jgi:hypothetical protein